MVTVFFPVYFHSKFVQLLLKILLITACNLPIVVQFTFWLFSIIFSILYLSLENCMLTQTLISRSTSKKPFTFDRTKYQAWFVLPSARRRRSTLTASSQASLLYKRWRSWFQSLQEHQTLQAHLTLIYKHLLLRSRADFTSSAQTRDSRFHHEKFQVTELTGDLHHFLRFVIRIFCLRVFVKDHE